MVADFILMLVMYVYDFDRSFDPFFVASIVFINMKFIFFIFPLVLCSADFAAQLFSISPCFFCVFAVLSFKVELLTRLSSRDVA